MENQILMHQVHADLWFAGAEMQDFDAGELSEKAVWHRQLYRCWQLEYPSRIILGDSDEGDEDIEDDDDFDDDDEFDDDFDDTDEFDDDDDFDEEEEDDYDYEEDMDYDDFDE